MYWYRPTEVRDESTGQLVGYKKKFSSDLLQRNYNQIADMFGCSYGQAKEAIVFLESMGIIKRIFRDIEINGVVCNNVLFIDLKVERLKELTYPAGEEKSAEVGGNFTGGESKIPQRGVAISSQGAAEFHRTNTETSSEISSEITPSIHQHDTAEYEPALISESSTDGLSDRKLKSIVEEEMDVDGLIPYAYKNDPRKVEYALKYLIGYDAKITDYGWTDQEKNTLEMMIECLVEMACADDVQNYKGSSVYYAKVIDKINSCIQSNDGLDTFFEMTIDNYLSAAGKQTIKNEKKYMKSVIWNSFSTYKVKFDSYFVRSYQNDG